MFHIFAVRGIPMDVHSSLSENGLGASSKCVYNEISVNDCHRKRQLLLHKSDVHVNILDAFDIYI